MLTVSKGPAQVQVPDVEGFDLGTARATLRGAGFRVDVVFADTDLDSSEDGIVLAQSPAGGIDADPKSTVTLTVGRYVEPPPAETFPTDTTTTETTPTDDASASVTRVAILMGGRSSEHDISLASARSVIAALDPARYDVVTIEIGHDGAGARRGHARGARERRRRPCRFPPPTAS